MTDSRVKHVSFTGSAAIGWKLREKAGRRGVTLELGGNATVIVHDDADVTAAATAVAAGAFAYAGQSCISVQRVFVHRDVYESFRAELLALLFGVGLGRRDVSRRFVLLCGMPYDHEEAFPMLGEWASNIRDHFADPDEKPGPGPKPKKKPKKESRKK